MVSQVLDCLYFVVVLVAVAMVDCLENLVDVRVEGDDPVHLLLLVLQMEVTVFVSDNWTAGPIMAKIQWGIILAIFNQNTLILNFRNNSQPMSDDTQNTEPNSASEPKKKAPSIPQEGRPEPASKIKKKRKTITASKMHAFVKDDFEASNGNGKQVRLTQFWKMPNSQSVSKNNLSSNESLRKKIEEEMELKNRKIVELRKERDQVQRKYNILENEKKIYQNKTRTTLRQILLEQAKSRRAERGQINPAYGYFRDPPNCVAFMEGPYLKNYRLEIAEKQKQLVQLKLEQSGSKKDKQSFQFRQKFYQKQIDQMTQHLKQREKTVQSYKERLKCAEKEANCYYAKLGWPAVGDEERFQVLELLGSGGFGEVYRCYDLLMNCYVALKENRFNNAGTKHEEIKQQFLKHVNRQVKIQKNLHHPNIARFIQMIKIDQSQVSFVLQYCQGPQLSKYLKRNQCLQQRQAKHIIRQILSALKYLFQQDNKIIHYDLKPSNIMFHRGTVKILDFGLCKQMDTDETRMNLTSQGVGTYWYLPPETFLDCGAEVSSKVDIWSTGVIFYELLYGRRPFGHGVSQTKIMNEGIILKEALKLEFPAQTPLKYKVSEAAKNFITDCLKYKQEDRLSPFEAYDHVYWK